MLMYNIVSLFIELITIFCVTSNISVNRQRTKIEEFIGSLSEQDVLFLFELYNVLIQLKICRINQLLML